MDPVTPTPKLLKKETQPGDLSLYLEIRVDPDVRPMTAVFFPAGRSPTPNLDVILYLRGMNDAPTIDQYLTKPGYQFREYINTSQYTNFVLVAPSLGMGSNARDLTQQNVPAGKKGIPTPHGLDRYLEAVLAGIREHAPQQVSGVAPNIQSLILAAHSRGGVHTQKLISSRGTFHDSLLEIWGYDCLYPSDQPGTPPARQTVSPLTARRWMDYCQAHPDVKVCHYSLMRHSCTGPSALALQDLAQKRYTSSANKLYHGNVWVSVLERPGHHYVPYCYFPDCLEDAGTDKVPGPRLMI